MPYKNKENQAISAKKHYESNKDACKKRAKLFTEIAVVRNKEYIANFLNKNPCVDCGETDIVVLDFDHVTGQKCFNVSTGVKNGVSIVTLQEEMDKCEVRCSNCHRKVTHQRRLSENQMKTK